MYLLLAGVFLVEGKKGKATKKKEKKGNEKKRKEKKKGTAQIRFGRVSEMQ